MGKLVVDVENPWIEEKKVVNSKSKAKLSTSAPTTKSGR